MVHHLEQFTSLNGDEVIVTADLDNMYNNVSVPLAIEAMLSWINKYLPEYLVFGTDSESNNKNWSDLITNLLKHVYFKFGTKVIKQVKGVPMGSPFAPVLAIIAVNSLITRPLNGSDLILFRKMYIDDGIFIFKSETSSDTIIKVLNSMIEHPQSDLTWDQKSIKMFKVKELLIDNFDSELTFLDMKINAIRTGPEYKLVTSVYSKPLGSYQYLHWKSSHPRATKRAVITGELTRRLKLSHSEQEFSNSYHDLTIKLLSRSYPLSEVETAFGKFNFSYRQIMVQKSFDKITRHRTSCVNPWAIPHMVRYRMVPMVLIYDPRYHRSIVAVRKRIQELLDNELFSGSESYRVVIAYRKNKPFVAGTRCLS